MRNEKKFGSGGIRTHASEETGALNQRLRPLGHATCLPSCLILLLKKKPPITMSFTVSFPGCPYQSLWRNRLARSTVNRKVGGSSPPWDVLSFAVVAMSYIVIWDFLFFACFMLKRARAVSDYALALTTLGFYLVKHMILYIMVCLFLSWFFSQCLRLWYIYLSWNTPKALD